jgi:hypothetical protein
MTVTRYAYRDGKMVEIWRSDDNYLIPEDPLAPYIHQDSFKQPLRHPVTGEMVDSMTRWSEINRSQGLQVVGNDRVANGPQRNIKDRISEEMILDRIHKVEAIASDPSKLRAAREMNQMLTARNLELLKNRRS